MHLWMILLATLSLTASVTATGAAGVAATDASVQGVAFCRERVTLPPDAVFEATLADTTRADAPAEPLGRVTLDGSSGPPFAFSIPYDPARIDPRGRYAVRARIILDGQLLFASDTLHPVFGGGQPYQIEILMRPVGAAHGLRLPASPFDGERRYLADAATFTDCLTGRRYPVAFEGDWPSAERAYLAAVTEPAGPLHTNFEGRLVARPKMEGEGTEPTLVVPRLIQVWPDQGCERGPPSAHPHEPQ